MKFVVAVLALVSVLSVDARRTGGGRQQKQKGIPANAQTVATWTQTLVEQGVQQFAYNMADNPDQIWIFAPNKRGLKQQGYTTSKTLLDFTGGSLVAVMRLKKWCFRLPGWSSNITKQAVLTMLSSYNGTIKGAAPPTEYYATDLDQAVVQGRPGIASFCSNKPVQDLTTNASDAVAVAKTFLVATLSKPPVSDQLSIVVAKKQKAGRRGASGKKNGSSSRGGNRGRGRNNF